MTWSSDAGAMRCRALVSCVVVIAGVLFGAPAHAQHYCAPGTGTFIEFRLPENPAAPDREALYFHDRNRHPTYCLIQDPMQSCDENEGIWIFLENGLAEGYNSGGIPLVGPMAATGSADTPCGAILSSDGLTATAKPGADDVIF